MRKILAVATAAAVLFAGNYVLAQPTRSGARLKQDYDDYNENFFSGTLPKDVVVSWANIPKDKDGQYVMGFTHEDPTNGTYSIDIDIKTNVTWDTADTTMLHEMCHVKTMNYAISHNEDEHGPSFKACIVNLELQGAFTDLL
jgi:SprT-like family protein